MHHPCPRCCCCCQCDAFQTVRVFHVCQGEGVVGSDECAMYFVNFFLDIAIGTFVIWCFVRVQELTARRFGIDSLKVQSITRGRCVCVFSCLGPLGIPNTHKNRIRSQAAMTRVAYLCLVCSYHRRVRSGERSTPPYDSCV